MKKPNKQEIKILREKFIAKFCKEKGWNKEELTTRQMFIITNNINYIDPDFK
jgi:hypothetical protein